MKRQGWPVQASNCLIVCVALLLGCTSAGNPLLSSARADETTTSTPPATGNETTAKTKTAATQFTPGVTLRLMCQTEGIGVGHAPPKTTKGAVGLELTIGDGNSKPGQWKVTSIDTQHKEAFAAYLKIHNMCGDGCPLRLSPEIGAELWAPKPMAIDKLNKNDLLVLVTINEKTLELKSSTFQGVGKGSAPLVFEKGTCEKTQ